MRNRKFFAIICVLLLTFAVSLVAAPVKVIAIHFGNPEYEGALDKEDFPGFEFYRTDGSTYRYQQDQKLIGNPNYLPGYYGEIPEKMGFSANYTYEKGSFYSHPFEKGIIYVIGKNGIIAARTSENSEFDEFAYNTDGYYADYDVLRTSIKKLVKEKYTKPAKKMVYIPKVTASGELEPYGKSKIDKASKGLVGWTVPEITVYDDAGEAHKLNELTADNDCVVIFYTMDGVLYKRGDKKDGSVDNEYYAEKPVNKADEAQENIESADTPGALFKAMVKAAAEDETTEYVKWTGGLRLVKKVLDDMK